MTSRTKRSNRLVLLFAGGVASAALAASCLGGTRDLGVSQDAGPDARAEAASDASGPDARDATSEPPDASCDPDPHSSYVPKGWVRFPDLPCTCTVWISPSASLMTPVPHWITTSGGWLQLDVPTLTGYPLGDNYAGRQEIAYESLVGPTNVENAVLDVTDDRYLFEERVVATSSASFQAPCGASIDALGQGVALENASDLPHRLHNVTTTTTSSSPSPSVVQVGKESNADWFWGVGAHAAGVAVAGHLDGFTWPPAQSYLKVWVQSGFNIVPAFGWDSTLFFASSSMDASPFIAWQYYAWTAAGGARLFIGTGKNGSAPQSICSMGTDGTTLAWIQVSGWDGNGWQQAQLMRAPFTTDAAALEPQLVRTLPGYKRCSSYSLRIGGGYVAAASVDSFAPATTLVVRLADGAMWQLAPSGTDVMPLYITSDELGAYESIRLDGGANGPSQIIRYPLSLLGAPNLP